MANAYVKVSGAWKEVTEAYVKVGGVWKSIYDPVTPGSLNLTSPGSYSWSLPNYNTLTVQLWGGGGRFLQKIFARGDLTSKSTIPIIVGAKGIGGSASGGAHGGNGANGRAFLQWN